MAEVIKMPKMSDTMEEGVIASWLVKEGDEVSTGDILAEVETDKATMELESYEDGVILHIGIKEGDAVPVDGVIAIIGEKGEDIDDLLKEIENGGGSDKSDDKKESDEKDKSDGKKSEKDSGEEIDASDVNASLITMPKMSDTMEEGVIASWLKKEGDKVEAGDILAEVETDKATMELEAYEDGTLLYIGIKEGDAAPIDGVIAVIGEEGADYEKLIKAHEQKSSGGASKKEDKEEKKEKSEDKSSDSKSDSGSPKPTPPAESANKDKGGKDGGRIFASPLAKKIAKDKGIDLAEVDGSGGNGRIIKSDVENFTPKQKSKEAPKQDSSSDQAMSIPQVVGEESYEEVKVSQMRKTVAKRLSESKFTAPHFYVTMEINMDKAMEARKSINEVSPVKISFNDMVIKAVAASLRQHPKVNSSWMGDKIRRNNHIHVGMAVAVEEGLLVPVIRFADNKSLSHIATEAKDFAKKAKNKELEQKDWEGNTFTISNLGMFGVEEFTAIINPPDACILAVGGIKQTAIVKDGELVPGNVMKVTLSCDHRVVDGAVGSAFLQTLKGLLEDPVRILI
ncbi:pyruvate dehydrogenase complex dihydrolipoamide acetyltransferase [Marivirga salinae]|uniref:Acetyltransferase component of pyruvate dehydrogenase complex n=1 Tax=Marivirga salinarum TaxID=3059078 RepID=A0AA51N9F6_9BACT|nr:pyruvate dehydrogenase complex dihydrolipoamide acetyltransferase [Marivirga sp. BDSF4-3]WMN11242.1 pyruvate dehydrogenase complex dihydrolipoamide acetyltransferase [Marivirga sp. BDSF4-3]